MDKFNNHSHEEDIEDTFSDAVDYNDDAEDIDIIQDSDVSAPPAIIVKAQEYYDKACKKACQIYNEPDEDTKIPNKKGWIITGICTAASILLAVALYFFLTSYSFYTTGVTVDEFIDAFNSVELTSDSDIYDYIPSYTDVLIPEDAKLGGKNEIELMDGHIVVSAKTRFGRIVSLTVRNVDFPNYNPESYVFEVDRGDYSYMYYYICFGKCAAAFDNSVKSTYDAAEFALQLHQYAYIYLYYGDDGFCHVDVNGNRIGYQLEAAQMVVEPIRKTITTATWPEIFNKDTEVSSSDIPGTDETASDTDAA